MRRPIDRYLAELRKALSGADPATIQDALSDAEEHLTTALAQALETEPQASPEALLDRIVTTYGAPEEVAAAYKEMEHMTTVTLARADGGASRSLLRRLFGVVGDIRAYAAVLYMCFSLITGIVYFTWAAAGLSLSVGLLVLIIGFPFLTLFLLSARGIALIEGRLVEAVLGERMPRRPVFRRRDLGMWGGIKALFGDRTTWLAILYMVLQLPLGIIYFTLIVTLGSVSLGLIAEPVLKYAFSFPIYVQHDHSFFLPDWAMPLVVLAGFLLLVATLHAAKGIGRLHAKYAKALLVKKDRAEAS
jgi:uncharacterized membrane protein